MATEFDFGELGVERLVSFTAEHNARSRAVMRRLGMCHDPAHDFAHPHVDDTRIRRHVLYRLTPTARPVPPGRWR